MNHRITSPFLYLAVFAALIVLTFITVEAAKLDLGPWHTVVGLVIASAKVTLVVLFFMHVWHSSRLTWMVILAGLAWLALLIGLTLTDYLTRAWSLY